jgi:hypothetical protein
VSGGSSIPLRGSDSHCPVQDCFIGCSRDKSHLVTPSRQDAVTAAVTDVLLELLGFSILGICKELSKRDIGAVSWLALHILGLFRTVPVRFTT